MPGILSYSKFYRGQQDYKAYSLGLFRVNVQVFSGSMYREIIGFHKSYTLKMSSFDKFYAPGYVKFC